MAGALGFSLGVSLPQSQPRAPHRLAGSSPPLGGPPRVGAPHTPMVLAVGAPSVLRINLHTRAHGTASLFPPPCFIDATFVFASLQIQLTWNDVTSVNPPASVSPPGVGVSESYIERAEELTAQGGVPCALPGRTLMRPCRHER